MKLAICGKGGCGKSTITALLAKQLAADGKKVLVIDSDESNYGLHQQLGLELPEDFIHYFGGKGQMLETMSKNGPMNMEPLFDKKWKLSDIPAKYRTEKDGVMLMSPGKIVGANEACACPFAVLMVQFVPNLELAEDEIVLVDMEAGIEHFGRGTDNVVDKVLMVVDPSYESIKLAKKIGEIATSIGKPISYVLNKTTAETEATVREALGGYDILAVVPASPELMKAGLLGEELNLTVPQIKKMANSLA